MVDGGVEDDVGLRGEERFGVADDGDKSVAEVLDERCKYFDFRGVATFGDANHHIVFLHHTEVTVYSVGGVHKDGRSAC